MSPASTTDRGGAGPVGSPVLPPEAWWVALAGLPDMGPARLGVLWEATAPQEAWRLVASGGAARLPAMAAALGAAAEAQAVRWARAASAVDVAGLWDRHREVTVAVRGQPAMPARFDDDIEPPTVLFAAGDPSVVEGPVVAIVGTRRCSRGGAELAHEIGRACAAAGARVASGLAVGIDAAAHAGALAAGPDAAPPIAVVGSGLDVVYPTRSRALWRAVAQRGVVLSEYPLGTPPARWRFPARNRLVAALADVVVVVESHRVGGSMYTVDEALARQRTVLAVPGSVHAPTSAGTNWLLSQGAPACCGPEDVVVALGLAVEAEPAHRAHDPRPKPTGEARRVLRALGWDPATLDTLAERTGLGLGALALAVERLEVDGWVHRPDGRIERRPRP